MGLGHERLGWRQGLGVLLTLGGVALALGDAVGAGAAPGIGDAAVLASAFCGGVCSVLYPPELRRPCSAAGERPGDGGGGAVSQRMGVDRRRRGAHCAGSAMGLHAIAFIGVSSGVGYFLWLWALRHAAASKVSLFLSLSPLTAMLLGVLWLGEPFASTLALAVAGLRVAQDHVP